MGSKNGSTTSRSDPPAADRRASLFVTLTQKRGESLRISAPHLSESQAKNRPKGSAVHVLNWTEIRTNKKKRNRSRNDGELGDVVLSARPLAAASGECGHLLLPFMSGDKLARGDQQSRKNQQSRTSVSSVALSSSLRWDGIRLKISA